MLKDNSAIFLSTAHASLAGKGRTVVEILGLSSKVVAICQVIPDGIFLVVLHPHTLVPEDTRKVPLVAAVRGREARLSMGRFRSVVYLYALGSLR